MEALLEVFHWPDCRLPCFELCWLGVIVTVNRRSTRQIVDTSSSSSGRATMWTTRRPGCVLWRAGFTPALPYRPGSISPKTGLTLSRVRFGYTPLVRGTSRQPLNSSATGLATSGTARWARCRGRRPTGDDSAGGPATSSARKHLVFTGHGRPRGAKVNAGVSPCWETDPGR